MQIQIGNEKEDAEGINVALDAQEMVMHTQSLQRKMEIFIPILLMEKIRKSVFIPLMLPVPINIKEVLQ